MKPEHYLDCHVDHGGEIVTAPDVAQLVRHDRFHLPRCEAIQNLVRQQTMHDLSPVVPAEPTSRSPAASLQRAGVSDRSPSENPGKLAGTKP